jgi:S-ribosylhomocysteine lyase
MAVASNRKIILTQKGCLWAEAALPVRVRTQTGKALAFHPTPKGCGLPRLKASNSEFMIDIEQLGWEPRTVGELDHRLLKAPHVKLRSCAQGSTGDVVYADCINPPNVIMYHRNALLRAFPVGRLSEIYAAEFHLDWFDGLSTGFYLVLFNEGRAQTILDVYEKILNDILTASEVPYANIAQCGNYKNHSLELAQQLAQRVLDAKSNWRQVV